MGKMPTYFEWYDGDDEYHVEYDATTGVVLVEMDYPNTEHNGFLTETIGVYRFSHGLLVEAIGRGVLPDALADMIEQYYRSWTA